MKTYNWIGIICLTAFFVLSLFISNYMIKLPLYIFGSLMLLINGCTAVENDKYRIFFPGFQFCIGLLSILYGSLDSFNKSGIIYSILMFMGGILIILGLKISNIIFHRAIASPLTLFVMFYAFSISKKINMLSAWFSGIIAIIVILFGIVLSDKKWRVHLFMKKN